MTEALRQASWFPESSIRSCGQSDWLIPSCCSDAVALAGTVGVASNFCYTLKLAAPQPPAEVTVTDTVTLWTVIGAGWGLVKTRFRGTAAAPG